ncbi:MAG: hypothetical protein WBL40_22670 [Terrimicrobiaceae bacterium]
MLAKRPERIEKANSYHGPQLNDYAEKRARGLIRMTLERGSGNAAAGAQGRLAQRAACCRDSETMRLDLIPGQFNMRTRAATCRLAAESRRRLATDRALRVESRDGVHRVTAGQSIIVSRGEWVRYSTPAPEGAEYIAVCVPGFSPATVHRDSK